MCERDRCFQDQVFGELAGRAIVAPITAKAVIALRLTPVRRVARLDVSTGVVTSYTIGGLIHILLVATIVMVLIRVIQGRNPLAG